VGLLTASNYVKRVLVCVPGGKIYRGGGRSLLSQKMNSSESQPSINAEERNQRLLSLKVQLQRSINRIKKSLVKGREDPNTHNQKRKRMISTKGVPRNRKLKGEFEYSPKATETLNR